MNEFMYGQSSILIVLILLLFIVLSMELGFQFGRRKGNAVNESERSQVIRIEASLLGLLSLLIGFTFSLALQRYDDRSRAVVAEANAIGTTYLRAQLLPMTIREDVQALIRGYVDIRVQESRVPLSEPVLRDSLNRSAKNAAGALWRYALNAAGDDASPVRTGFFIQSLNETFDAFDQREAMLNIHVPEIVYYILFLCFALTAATLGFSSGIAQHRPSLATKMFVVLMVLVTFLIIDMDRPRRGLIRVSQESMITLQRSFSNWK